MTDLSFSACIVSSLRVAKELVITVNSLYLTFDTILANFFHKWIVVLITFLQQSERFEKDFGRIPENLH